MNTFVISCYTEETFKIVVHADNIEDAQELALECMSNDDYKEDYIKNLKETSRDFGVLDATDVSGHEVQS